MRHTLAALALICTPAFADTKSDLHTVIQCISSISDMNGAYDKLRPIPVPENITGDWTDIALKLAIDMQRRTDADSPLRVEKNKAQIIEISAKFPSTCLKDNHPVEGK